MSKIKRFLEFALGFVSLLSVLFITGFAIYIGLLFIVVISIMLLGGTL